MVFFCNIWVGKRLREWACWRGTMLRALGGKRYRDEARSDCRNAGSSSLLQSQEDADRGTFEVALTWRVCVGGGGQNERTQPNVANGIHWTVFLQELSLKSYSADIIQRQNKLQPNSQHCCFFYKKSHNNEKCWPDIVGTLISRCAFWRYISKEIWHVGDSNIDSAIVLAVDPK